MKKAFSLIAAAIITICSFTSCSFIGADTGILLKAPEITGEMHDIRSALYKRTGAEITLIYPKRGENNAAFTKADLDGDGSDEAIVLYAQENDDGVNAVHINIIDKKDGKWTSVADREFKSSNVVEMYIASFGSSAGKSIVIGTELLSAQGNLMNVLDYSKGKLNNLLESRYSKLLICDLLSTGKDQLLTTYFDSTQMTNYASLYRFDNSTSELVGRAPLDAKITGFASVKVGALSGGTKAVFIDEYKGASAMVTDMIVISDGKPYSVFYDSQQMSTQITMRESLLTCRDVNADKVTDIPFTTFMPGYSVNTRNACFLTTWMSFDGSKFYTTSTGDYDEKNGFYFIFPDVWTDGGVTMAKNGTRTVYSLWNQEEHKLGEDLMIIDVYDLEEYRTSKDEGFFTLAQTNNLVYAASILRKDQKYIIDQTKTAELFQRIGEGK